MLDRQGATVTSAITNLDVHDIARSAMTYGLCSYYLIHPILAQRRLVERIKEHWIEGSGDRRIPDRIAPMRLVHVLPSLADAVGHFSDGQIPLTWTTSAGGMPRGHRLSHQRAATLLSEPGPPVLLVFGTGWGLSATVHESASDQLVPIKVDRTGSYNHLSVRAAAAIILDRLLGECSKSISESI